MQLKHTNVKNKKPHVITIRSGDHNSPKLFLMPPGTGTSLSFLAYAKLKNFAVYAINDLFLWENETYSSIRTIAETYLSQIKIVQSNGPYLLGGYSFGGHVALEIAHILIEEKQSIELVLLIDTLISKLMTGTNLTEDEVMMRFTGTTTHPLLSNNDFLKMVAKNIKKCRCLQREIDQFKKYNGKTILLQAKECMKNFKILEPMNGLKMCCDNIQLYKIEGDHMSIFDAQHVDSTIARTQEALDNHFEGSLCAAGTLSRMTAHGC